MKRQKKFRFLSFILCCLFLLCTGCEFGGLGEDGGISTQSLDGAKVLSRPADFSFEEATGDFSENFFNLFSREVLLGLYNVYNAQQYRVEDASEFFKDLESVSGQETYGNFSKEENKFYLYDSIRYTISQVKTVRDSDEEIVSQTVVLDFEDDWNWKISAEAEGKKIFFENTDVDTSITKTDNSYELNIDTLNYDEWTDLYTNKKGYIPDYLSAYDSNDGVDTTVQKAEGEFYKKYWYSPTYDTDESGTAVEGLINHYQDALEYVTYLFVLGFDVESDAQYFNFNIQFATNGMVSDILVNYGGQSMSVKNALQQVKERYNEAGNFVGITEKNKQQIIDFVRDYVIGQQSSNVFEVEFVNKVQDATTKQEINDTKHEDSSLTFNRNYDKIIANIVDYACTQAPIGLKEDGSVLNLDDSYPVSQIIDYSADNFFLNYTTPDGKNDDDNEYMFYYCPAAEYQSFVLYPLEEQVSTASDLKFIHDIWLGFEYDTEVEGKTMLDELKINVGVRYYSKSSGGYTVTAQTQTPLTITKGKNSDGVFGDNSCYIGYSEKEQDQYQIATPSDFSFKTTFNKHIGNDAINPEVDGQAVNGGYRKLIDGGQNNRARDYFQLEPSSSYGHYVTLKPEMFAGDDGCDYLEVFFDIVKDKSRVGVNYNFKVAIGLLGVYSQDEL